MDSGHRIFSSRRAGEASAVVCCTHGIHSAEALHAHLEGRGIITTPRLGRLRISPHVYNTREEIDALIAALLAPRG
jgi:cysteine desulfurase / selenocysteine lyase